jgi:glycosyltransferase involved in cell wall biosynthesis
VKVCIVDGGSYVLPFSEALALEVRDAGAEVDVFLSSTAYNAEVISRLSEIMCVRRYRVSGTVSGRVFGAFHYLRMISSLLLNAKKYDVIFWQFPGIALLDIFLFLLFGRKILWICHNPRPHGSRGGVPIIYRILGILSARVVFLSEYSRREFLDLARSKYIESKALILQHPLLRLPNTDRSYLDVGAVAEPVVLTVVGNIKPYKGVHRLLGILAAAKSAGYPLTIEIWGKWDSSLLEVKAELLSEGCHIYDHFLAEFELAGLLRSNRVFILPNVSSTQSGVVYLLLGSGCLFIAARSGDVEELMERHDFAGLCLSDFSWSTVREALDHFMGSRRLSTYSRFEEARASADSSFRGHIRDLLALRL